jgi:hypothetical protein
MIRHSSGVCIELSSTNDKDIFMNKCDFNNKYQKWSWKKRSNDSTVTH